MKRLWIPLVMAAVVVVGGFAVWRLHGVFGSQQHTSYSDTAVDESKPYDPKRLTYEVFGPPGTVADISYFDVNSDPQRVNGVHLPWSEQITTNQMSVVGNVVAQGDSDSIGCRILLDGKVKAEKISHEVHAFTFCLLKGA
ncbi:MmpS family protein [Mycobacterium sp.]|uniref:MmpS family protein n=1 Tax=Mycobacterium sp. TaxID=1785 RepID=UPI0031D25C5A